MAITISGENNNDRILASDGVIDQISGINIVGLITASHINVGSNIQLGNAGIITATTFVGNVTGNVNSTSPLLLQTGGSERFRITGNNELGIAGANYGSAGQVLTSGGSGSAVTWSAIPTQVTINNNAANRIITGEGGTTLNGESNLTFDGQTLTITAPTNDTPLIVNTGSSNGSHLRFQKDGANKHFIGSGGGFALGDIDDLAFRTVDNLIFGVGTSEKVRITSAGRLGIGDNSPDTMLHVTGSDNVLGLFESTDADSLIQFKDNSTSDTILMGALGGDDLLLRCDAGNIVFHVSNNNEKVRITSDGKVGINQSSPTAELEVCPTTTADDTATIFINAKNHDTNVASEAILKFGYGHSGNPDAVGHIKLVENGGNNFDGDFIFDLPTNNGSGGSSSYERFRIRYNGQVSISNAGTTFGTNTLLNIAPTNRTTAFSASDGDTWHDLVLKQGAAATTNSVGIAFEVSPSAYHKNAGTGIAAIKDGNNFDYGTHLAFITRPHTAVAQERLRITSSGDVQVNTGVLYIPDALRHLGDTDTQIKFPAADTISFETAGDERLRISSTGSVSIGGNAKAQKLTVVHNASQAGANDGTVTDSIAMFYGGKSTTVNSHLTLDETIIHIKGQITDTGTNSTGSHTTGKIVFSGRRATGAQSWIANETGWIYNTQQAGSNLVFYTANYSSNGGTAPTESLRIDYLGNLLPGSDNLRSLGSSSKRWANLYTGDLNLSNKGSENDVDNTWGDYTIQEGESDLFLINNRSGKKYKFNLTEVS